MNKRCLCLDCNEETQVLIKQLHEVSLAPHMGHHFTNLGLVWP